MVTITLYAKQKKRHRCTEQTFGLCGRRRGWDVLREKKDKYYLIFHLFHIVFPSISYKSYPCFYIILTPPLGPYHLSSAQHFLLSFFCIISVLSKLIFSFSYHCNMFVFVSNIF